MVGLDLYESGSNWVGLLCFIFCRNRELFRVFKKIIPLTSLFASFVPCTVLYKNPLIRSTTWLKMVPHKQAEEAIVSTLNENSIDQDPSIKDQEDEENTPVFSVKSLLWHGGSAWDAWFSCASNQVIESRNLFRSRSILLLIDWLIDWLLKVAQVLLTLPYSFSQMGMLSGIILQVFYGIMGSWTAYLISVLYIEYRSRKEKENASFKNHVIQVNKYIPTRLSFHTN